jgi:hypothetical protein
MTTEPMPHRNIFMVQSSYPQSYGEAVVNPFGNQPCRRSTTPSSRTKIGICFPFLQEGNFLGENGSIGPRAQQMDRLADKKLG